MNKFIFPCVLMFLNICASIGYFWNKDIWMGFYWITGFFLTFIITFK